MLEQKLKLNKYNNFNIKNLNNRFFFNLDIFFLKSFDLLKILKNSYNLFFQFDKYKNNIQNIGLQKIFKNIFPIYITNYNIKIEFLNYRIIRPFNNYIYCINNGLTYSFILKSRFKLTLLDNINNLNKYCTEEIFIASIPMITENCTFVINGIEKVLISNFNRAPGLYLTFKKKYKNHLVKLIPDKGFDLDFFINKNNFLILRIKNKEILVTDIIKSFGYSNNSILNEFYNFEFIYFFNKNIKLKFIEKLFLNFSIPYNIFNDKNEILIYKNVIITDKEINILKLNSIEYIDIDKNYILNKFLGEDIYINNFKIANANDIIDKELLSKILKYKLKLIKILFFSSKAHSSISLSINSNKLDFFNSIKNVNKFINLIGFSFLSNNFSNYIKNKNNDIKFFISDFCRKRINLKLKRNFLSGSNYLNILDIIDISKILISFEDNINEPDDMQDLDNLILNSSGEIIGKLFYDNLLDLKKNVEFKIINFFNKKKIKPSNFINFNSLNIIIKKFFNTSKFSQFLDQTNILSELTHKRKVSFLGILGISKLHSGFEVRELHSSHYSRLCPVETSEGINIGLVSSLSLFCNINDDKILLAPYYKIKNNNIIKKIIYLNPYEEKNSIISNLNLLKNIDIYNKKEIIARFNKILINIDSKILNYIDINSFQTLSVSASLIPFIQHNDSNRALMASNMLKQSLPLLFPKKPLVATGLENIVSFNSKSIIFSKSNGIVNYVNNNFLIIKKLVNFKNFYYYDYDYYFLNKYRISNQNTNISQNILVNIGDKIKINDILINNNCSDNQELALGQNVLVAFMSWGGYNFEDSIIVSEKLIYNNNYTSLNLFEIDIPVYNTDLGPEYITNNIYNINNVDLSNLNEYGLVKNGSLVGSGDILVGKICPVLDNNKEFSPEKKIINAIFSKKKNNEIDSSFYLPNNFIDSSVKSIEIFFSKNFDLNNSDKKYLKNQLNSYFKIKKKNFNFFLKKIKRKINFFLLGKKIFLNKRKDFFIVNNLYLKNINFKNIFKINIFEKYLDDLFKKFLEKFKFFLKNYKNLLKNKKNKFFKNLPLNIIKIIKIFIISKRKLMIGDKMSGRHGNKGVVSKILPINEMPYMSDGRVIDIILNPLGVPSRMNVGQLLEVHLGLACFFLGIKISILLKNKNFTKIKEILLILYKNNFININPFSYNNIDIINFSKKIKNGFYLAISPFSNFGEKEINFLLNLVFLNDFLNLEKSNCNKKFILYDGLSNKKFDNYITVGIMYFLKLNHLVDDKIHARSTGPYSLVTQQPLKGRANMGGQRVGEMEVWALEAHGASSSLREMLTIKSDDTEGRYNIYKNIVEGYKNYSINMPETFNVMMRNINSLGMYIRFKEK